MKTIGNGENKKLKTVRRVKIAAFFAVLGVLAVIGLMWFLRPEISQIEKRELTEFPKFTFAGLIDGSFAQGVSEWYSDTYPLREPFILGAHALESLYGDRSDQIIVDHRPVDDIPPVPSSGESVPPTSATSTESSETTAASASASVTEPTVPADQGAEWFNDAVFVGDSISVMLSYYADNGSLGNANFLCQGSLSYANALWDLNQKGNVHPTYEGQKITVDEGVKKIGAKKVLIMLGMNDVGIYGVESSITHMKTLIGRIREKSPGVQIYIQSVTPMLENMQRETLNNASITKFNGRLREVCAEMGFVYLDVASVLKNEAGNLIPSYCSDPKAMGIHLTYSACAQWVTYLKQALHTAG